ncbi:ribosomal protein mL11 [Acrasis kona]|uniref:Ribosomal protein mL11 n=1 Tax=Acrasis kona TaxID=1008807 RepID=A0AAW2YSW2_9EUKA
MVYHYCRCCEEKFNGISNVVDHVVDCSSRVSSGDEDILTILIKDNRSKAVKQSKYFLVVEMDSKSDLKPLDSFIRNVWMECCYHTSEFVFEKDSESRVSYYSHADQMQDHHWQPFSSIKIGDKLTKADDRFIYSYDRQPVFGVLLKISKGSMNGKPVRLLARNEPIQFKCVECKKIAGFIDPESHNFYCDNCREENENTIEFDEMSNSPRVGICGYIGDNKPYVRKADRVNKRKSDQLDE